MKRAKRILSLSIVLSLVLSINSFAAESYDLQETQVIVKHDLVEGTVEEITVQCDGTESSTIPYESEVSSNSIIGEDGREPIDFPEALPSKAIGLLRYKGPNGKNYSATGFLVADDLVLTAGHCLISAEKGGAASEITFSPAAQKGLSYETANGTAYYVPFDWSGYYDENFDWALIKIDKPLGESGYLTCLNHANPVGQMVEIQGYPSDYLSNPAYGILQAVGAGTVSQMTNYKLYYDVDTEDGQSGSPILWYNGYEFQVIGIHTEGTSTLTWSNSGVRISSLIISLINNNL